MESEHAQTRTAKCQSWGLMDAIGWHAADVIKVCALSVNRKQWKPTKMHLSAMHTWMMLMGDTGEINDVLWLFNGWFRINWFKDDFSKTWKQLLMS